MLLHKDIEAFKEIISEVSQYYGYQENQVEKDYYVSLFLKELISISDLPLIFKGGTSLSKAYHLIDRFSEDLDLAVQFEGLRLGNGQRKRLKIQILKTISNLSMVLENNDQIESDKDFNQYEISFSRSFLKTEGLLSHILVETIFPYQPYPCLVLSVSNYVTEFLINTNRIDLIDRYQLQAFDAKVQALERTLIDKIFAICDYHMHKRYSRNSRHIYDIHKIWNSEKLNKTSLSKIIDSIIRDRQVVGRSNFSCQIGEKPNEILEEIIQLRVYESDYKNITSNLITTSTTYDECISSLVEILSFKLLPKCIQDMTK